MSSIAFISSTTTLSLCTYMSVKRGFGVYLFFKNAVLGLGLGLGSVDNNPNPNLKQHAKKEKDKPRPTGPDPAFY